jgi:type IV pili sensor histidine kinase/response regulator
MARASSVWRNHGPAPWRALLRNLVLLACGAVAWQAAWAQASALGALRGADELVLGRYTTSFAHPPADLAQPLEVVVAITFPRSTVATVGEAVQHALLRSGYRLEQRELAGPALSFLLLPLPESQRHVGPYRLQDVLDLLVGSAWHWHADHAQRRVWFNGAPAQPASANDELPQVQRSLVMAPAASVAADFGKTGEQARTFPVAPPAAAVRPIE